MNKTALIIMALALPAGCIDTSRPSLDYGFELSDAYDVSPSIVFMRFNLTSNIAINNPRSEDISVEIDDARLTVRYADGAGETLEGTAAGGIVPANGEMDVRLFFEGIPVKYRMAEDPLRFSSLIKSYDVEVDYTAKTTFLGIIPYTKSDTVELSIPLDDIMLQDQLDKIRESLSSM